MKIINHLAPKNDTLSLIHYFLKLIGIGKIARHVNFKRASTITLGAVISWLMSIHFAQRSLFRAKPSEMFSTRTARNVLNDGRINWQKLVCLIAAKLIASLRKYIDHRRQFAFVIDDTLMSRKCSKKTELLAKTYDHDKHEYVNGYRGLTIGWSDGNTFFPVNFALMSTQTASNLIGHPAQTKDNRTIAGQRRNQAQRGMNDVAIELIKQVLNLGVKATYVLFDSWFTSPKMFWKLRQLGLYGIGMLKCSVKVQYLYRGRHYDIKALYRRLAASNLTRKHNYLYSSVVVAQYEGHQFPLKVVFVSKHGCHGQYLVLATTKISLRPEQIIQRYHRRWQIETYFKAAKQYLALDRSQIQSYYGQCGYIAVVIITFDFLSWQERLNNDPRTLGGMFYEKSDALPEVRFKDALVYLLKLLKQVLKQVKSINDDLIENIVQHFIARLPKNLQPRARIAV